MGYFISALFLCGFGYFFVVMLLVYGLGRVRSGVSEKKPFVSVVIAARNEKARIKTCLTSLMRQNYKSDLFEVVVADDRSVDGTSEILEEFKSFFENLKIIISLRSYISANKTNSKGQSDLEKLLKDSV